MGALSLSITETVLIFAGIPAAVIAVVYAAVYSTTARRADKRYRPGRPFTFAPVWFLAAPAPLAGEPAQVNGAKAVTGGPLLAALTAADTEVPTVGHREVGGASDSW
jgi:hypothetical protein